MRRKNQKRKKPRNGQKGSCGIFFQKRYKLNANKALPLFSSRSLLSLSLSLPLSLSLFLYLALYLSLCPICSSKHGKDKTNPFLVGTICFLKTSYISCVQQNKSKRREISRRHYAVPVFFCVVFIFLS